MENKMMKSKYDLSSAVTFLLVGLGLGSVLALLLGPSAEAGVDQRGSIVGTLRAL
jgi:hypothetical protein